MGSNPSGAGWSVRLGKPLQLSGPGHAASREESAGKRGSQQAHDTHGAFLPSLGKPLSFCSRIRIPATPAKGTGLGSDTASIHVLPSWSTERKREGCLQLSHGPVGTVSPALSGQDLHLAHRKPSPAGSETGWGGGRRPTEIPTCLASHG